MRVCVRASVAFLRNTYSAVATTHTPLLLLSERMRLHAPAYAPHHLICIRNFITKCECRNVALQTYASALCAVYTCVYSLSLSLSLSLCLSLSLSLTHTHTHVLTAHRADACMQCHIDLHRLLHGRILRLQLLH